MKTFILMVGMAIALASCNSSQESNAKNSAPAEIQNVTSAATTPQNVRLGQVVACYLHLKNALVSDSSEKAATVGGQLQTSLVNLGEQTMNEMEKKAYSDIAADAEENAEHISKSGGNIKHQREHFQSLSEDMYGLVKAFGSSQTLYKDYCPMAKAYWLSEVKEIKNPYLGKSMPNCGTIKDTLGKQ